MSCIDDISFSATEKFVSMVVPPILKESLSDVVEDQEELEEITEIVSNKLFGNGSEFENCAIREINQANSSRKDESGDPPGEADPEKCIPLMKLVAGNEALNHIIQKELSEIKTPLESINDSLGDNFIIKDGRIFSSEFLSDLSKCQDKSKEDLVKLEEVSDKRIEELTMICAEDALVELSKIVTVDSLKQHPKLKEYDINLGAKYEKKIADSVSMCMKEEFDNNSEKTFSSFSSNLETGEKKCMDTAIKMTLDPRVVETIVHKLLTEKIGSTEHKWVIPEAKEEIDTYYRCYYRPPKKGSKKEKECTNIIQKYRLSGPRLSKGIKDGGHIEFLEKTLTRNAYKIVLSKVIDSVAFKSIEKEYGVILTKSNKGVVSKIIKDNDIIEEGISSLIRGEPIDELQESITPKVETSVAPYILYLKLIGNEVNKNRAELAMESAKKCFLRSPVSKEKPKCSIIDICISNQIIKIAQEKVGLEIFKEFSEEGSISMMGRYIKDIEIKDIKSAGDQCVKDFITCDDYSTFPDKDKEKQKTEIKACIKKAI